MKSRYRRGTGALFLCAVGLAIILMGSAYFQYVSKRVYDESTSHLVEVYSQVNNNFASFLERNWGNLDDWTHHLQIEDEKGVLKFLSGRQQYWKFSKFYFLAQDGQGITPDGVTEQFSLKNSHDALFKQKERIMSNETLPSGQKITLFAIPVKESTYKGFNYSAIAISYTNADIVASLDVDAFSGESMCLVIYTDGSVLLSTHYSGSAFENYFFYLSAGSDLDEKTLDKIRRNWENGVAGVVRCKIGGVNHYISYQPVGYQDCVLLGIVPESAASESLVQIQRATVDVLVKIFLLAGLLLLVWIIQSYRKKTKKSVLEILYRELMFDMLSNNVDDIFMMLDSMTLTVDYLSPNVERLIGISPKEISKNIYRLGDSMVEDYTHMSKKELDSIPIHSSRSWEHERIHQITSERRWYRETIYHESVQGVEKFVIVISDRTQERQMNQNLEEALAAAKSANEAKSHFLSNMSHDIRTPMNAIVGFAVLLEKDADNGEKVREYTRKISASSQHLLGLINDVLDMSKIESGKTSLNVAQFSLPELLEELYSILLPQAKAKQQTFKFHTKDRPAEQLLGDKLRLNQILINLLSNSIKYTQSGGEIDFTVQELPNSSSQYASLRFVVSDNGMGMSEEFLKTIFDPFSRETTSLTNSIQGTGLGMAITKNLVELMGGVIHVTSQQGMGSVFTVEMSFAIPKQDSTEEVWTRYGISRVLVADNQIEICQDIKEMMKDTGVEVVYVTDGKSAVETAVYAQKQKKGFNVILLDWKMPGQDGLETASQIRKKLHEYVPLLVLTSYDWGDIEDEARAVGIDAFMSKPFFVSNFGQTLETLYASREQKEEETPDGVLDGMLFLVAEDNELNAEILSEIMLIEGAQCDIAINGKEALEKFVNSEPDHYDMILMDVQMPVMNGYEATRQIRICGHQRAKTIPIVAMTANAFAEDVSNALDSGMNGHLSKPIDMDAVKAMIGQLKKRR